MISRRQFLHSAVYATAACATAVSAGPALAADPPNPKPNLLLILADDLGYGDLACYGATDSITPHIDALAKDGIRFTDAYSCAPLCAPARAGLLTGKYPQRFGFEFNAAPPLPKSYGLPPTQRILSEDLKSAGYATALIGKWHLGNQPNQLPTARGFDEFFGFLNGKRRYTAGYKDPENPILRNQTEVAEKEYLTEAFTRESLSFIEKNRSRPFFLYLAPNCPHVPIHKPPPKYLDRFKNIPDENRRNFAAMIASLDDQVGAIHQKLRQLNLLDNTLIIFMSDNGGALGPSKNTPFRGVKTELFEGGLRVPLILNHPTKIKPATSPRLSSILDLYPTLLDSAGLPIPDSLEGKPLTQPTNENLFWRHGPEYAIRHQNWKLIHLADNTDHLFDLQTNPAESKDLAPSNPTRVRDLTTLWQTWNQKNIDPLWQGFHKDL